MVVSLSLSLSPSVVKGGLKLADCAKKAEALWTKDKEKTISTIKDFAIRNAEDIVEQLPATAWEDIAVSFRVSPMKSRILVHRSTP